MSWMVRKVPVGTAAAADTPHSLWRKASELMRLAGETNDPEMAAELRKLSVLYAARATKLEAAAETSVAVTQTAPANSLCKRPSEPSTV